MTPLADARPPGASAGVDPRGPRLGAAVTTAVLAVVLVTGAWPLLVVQAAVFALGAVGRSPYAPLWRLARRTLGLGAPAALEDPRPLRTAQAVGLLFALVALVGVGTPVFAVAVSAALVAAFLNAAFGLCLGCELHVLLLAHNPWKTHTTRRSTA